MTISLILLAILTGPYLLAWLLRLSVEQRRQAGVLGLGLMFAFTGAGHFLVTDKMVQMLPPQLPARLLAVYLSGVLEIAAAAALLLPAWRRAVGWLLLAMLVGFLPVNVYAAIQRVPIGGHEWGPIYLALRIPLQLAMIAWTVKFTLGKPKPGAP